MKKKIGLLIPTLNGGGAERVVSRLSKILNDDYEIFLILFEDTYMKYDFNGKLINMDIKSKNILGKIMLPFRRCIRLKKIKRDEQLDLVISFLTSANIVNILAKVDKCKDIVSVRNYSEKDGKVSTISKIKEFIIKLIYNKADKIIAVSELIKQSLINDYKVEKSKIVTIYNPYDVEEIDRLSNENIEEYESFFNSNKIFISVGRQTYQKGFWHLIKAFKIAHEKDNSIKLVLVGEGAHESNIKKLIEDFGLTESVLLTGYTKNPYKYMKRSQVYVLSSLFEGFPNAMAESLACDCAVIAADCKSGPKEILYNEVDINRIVNSIEYGEFGVIVPELNEKECWDKLNIDDTEVLLGQAMYELINNEKKLNHYMTKSRERILDFSFDICRDKFIDVIENL